MFDGFGLLGVMLLILCVNNKSDEVSCFHTQNITSLNDNAYIYLYQNAKWLNERTPTCLIIMTQKCVDFNYIALCKTTIRAEDHGLDRSISPTHIWWLLHSVLLFFSSFSLCLSCWVGSESWLRKWFHTNPQMICWLICVPLSTLSSPKVLPRLVMLHLRPSLQLSSSLQLVPLPHITFLCSADNVP